MNGKDVTPGNAINGKHVVSKSGSGTRYHGEFTDAKPGKLVNYAHEKVTGPVWQIKTAGGLLSYYFLVHRGVSQFVFKCK